MATATAQKTKAVGQAAPTVEEMMRELEALGSEQTAKTYRRHGVGDNDVFGVSYAAFGTLKKRLKTNQALARDLWHTGNHDARVLALMIADPVMTTDDDLEAWVSSAGCYALTWPVAQVAAQRPDAAERAARWIGADDEWIERAGWQVVGELALRGAVSLPDRYFEEHLATIEQRIHGAKNRVRDAMNDVVIAIGGRNESLRRQAVAAAQRIGKVHVDHGDTWCKTPDAGPYIEKIWARRALKN